jgi:act minimal PKS chain-length factor (CLF/KS beta)
MSSASSVITGIGVVAPNGSGTEEYWQATLAGKRGIAPITRFDTARCPIRLAGQVQGFDVTRHIPNRLLPQTDVSTRYALAAASFALADAGAGTTTIPEYDMGVVTSNASGGFEFTHREFNKLWSKGPEFVSVYESFAWFYAVNTGQISIRHGMRGASCVLVGEQAGGLDALGHARRTVRRGTPFVVTGGVDSSFDPWGWVSHLSSGRIDAEPDPARAYRPFGVDAAGYIPGEGGAILVLEEAESARLRGAPRVYGELAGYASTFDPPPGTGRPPGLRRAAELALADADVGTGDVDVVFADCAGVPTLDRVEAEAIVGLFGPHGVPVAAPKTLVGRLYSGGGPLDVATALLSIRDSVVPAAPRRADVPVGYAIDLVQGEPRSVPVSVALVLARGRWGFNTAVVVRATHIVRNQQSLLDTRETQHGHADH